VVVVVVVVVVDTDVAVRVVAVELVRVKVAVVAVTVVSVADVIVSVDVTVVDDTRDSHEPGFVSYTLSQKAKQILWNVLLCPQTGVYVARSQKQLSASVVVGGTLSVVDTAGSGVLESTSTMGSAQAPKVKR